MSQWVARDESSRAEPLFKWPTTPLPPGSQLGCDASEAAVFMKNGQVIGILGAGRYALSPEGVPFLGMAMGPGGVVDAEIWFVTLTPVPGLKLGGRIGTIQDGASGSAVSPSFIAEATLRVADPARAVASIAGMGTASLRDLLGSVVPDAIREAVGALVAEGRAVAAVCDAASSAEIAQRAHVGAAPRLAQYGVELVSVDMLSLSLSPDDLARLAPAPPAEKVYEMMWDCTYCGQKKNLGLTHRHCPSCGAAQDANRRYFPPEDEKVAVQDHEYVGVDKHCSYCGGYSSRKAKHCGGCGAPLEGAGDAQLVQAPPVAPTVAQAAPPAPKKSSFAKIATVGCLGMVVLGIVLVLLMVFWKREAALRVAGHTWKREIVVERFGPVKDSAWCDALPSGAAGVTRHREQRSTKKVADGQDCHTKKVDRGNGTYVEKQECTPKYKETPVYDDKCDFTVDKWAKARTAAASGTAVTPPPQWPDTALVRTGQCVGCEREGKRTESYVVRFSIPDKSDTAECTFDDAAKWASYKDGSKWTGQVSAVGGVLSCDSLEAK